MNKNLLIAGAVVLILAVGYVLFVQAPPTSTPTDSMTENTVPTGMSESVDVVLNEQNASGESGTATLTEENGSVVVTLNVAGAPAEVAQPAHIHTGSCTDIGGVVYPLEFPVDGMSETTLPTTLSELAGQLPLALNVHKSASEADVYVSCGDLVL